MTTAQIFFHEDLQELLRTKKRGYLQRVEFNGDQTIKHLVESLGVPHTEVGQMIVDEHEIGFGYLVKSDDLVSVFPATAEMDRLSGMVIHGNLAISPRFILDNHLGKLASHLRMLGIDTDYSNQYQDQQLADLAAADARILLSRDRQLLMRKTIRYGYLLRSMIPDEQLIEVLQRFNLFAEIQIFKRCMNCNHLLEPVDKQQIEDQLQPLTRMYFFDFHICTGCGQIYWPGSHVERMQTRLREILPHFK